MFEEALFISIEMEDPAEVMANELNAIFSIDDRFAPMLNAGHNSVSCLSQRKGLQSNR